MNNLKSSYIKKAIFFPVIVVAILIAISIFAVPKIIEILPRGTDATKAVMEYDESNYYPVKYKNFADLRKNNFIGWLSSDDMALGCALTYDSDDEDTPACSLLVGSTEPWNEGSMIIIGSNADNEFRNLHKATINNEFTIDFYDHEAYTYAVKEIVPIANKDELPSYAKEHTALLCLPYNDFSKLGKEYFYTVFICEEVK